MGVKMIKFLQDTFCDPNVFWQAIEAIATVFAAGFAGYILLIELPKLKQESTSKKVENLTFVLDLLQERNFNELSNQIKSALVDKRKEYPEYMHERIIIMLGHLDYVGLFIELGFLDEDLFFYDVSEDIYNLQIYFTNFAHRENSRIAPLLIQYHRANKLLKKAAEYSQSRSQKVIKNIKEAQED